ncbi:MAG: type II secretion system F family protein [Planctomycetota bacterium]
MPVDLLIPVVVFVLVVGAGLVAVRGSNTERKAVKKRLEEIRTGERAAPELDDPVDEKPSAVAEAFGTLGGLKALGGPSEKLRAQLVRAGYNNKHAAEMFFGIKVASVVLFFGIGGVAATFANVSMMMGIFIAIGGMMVGSIIPSFILGKRISKRTTEIRNGLPNAIDLLEVCVSAGMGIDQAWVASATEIRDASPALSDEMSMVNLEMLLGIKRAEALKNMADRTGTDDLAALSSIITQADRFGTSMADALRTFAETMRELRTQKAEEAAEKMAIKLMLPMVVFIFPVVLLVSAGPAGLKMADLLGS